MPGKLVLCRHGQSEWNLKNLFTGWTDVDLTDTGREEASNAGKALNTLDYSFDIAFTSVLTRAIRTLWIIMDELDRLWLPVVRDWRLNERHYGALQGLNKAETAAKYGDEQVHIWRRSYSTLPPELEADDERHPRRDPRYADIAELPSRGIASLDARTRATVLGAADRTRDRGRQERVDCRPRKQPASAGQDVGRHFRSGNNRLQHSNRNSDRLRAGRKLKAFVERIPRRSRHSSRCCRRGGSARQSAVIHRLGEHEPAFEGEGQFIAPGAQVIGRVRLHADASVWFNAVLRGDNDWIIVGKETNVQDGAILHTDPGFELRLGKGVTVGHRAMLHGCHIGDSTLIGIGSTVLNGARLGKNTLLGAHALVTEEKTFPDGVLLLGSPARVVRELNDEEQNQLAGPAKAYVAKARQYRKELATMSAADS